MPDIFDKISKGDIFDKITIEKPKPKPPVPVFMLPMQTNFYTAPAVSARDIPEVRRSGNDPFSAALSGLISMGRATEPILRAAASPVPPTKIDVQEILASPINFGVGAAQTASAPFAQILGTADELVGQPFQKYVKWGMEAWKNGRYAAYRAALPEPIKKAVDSAMEVAIGATPFVAMGGVKGGLKAAKEAGANIKGRAIGEFQKPPASTGVADAEAIADKISVERGSMVVRPSGEITTATPISDVFDKIAPVENANKTAIERMTTEGKKPAEIATALGLKEKEVTGLKGIDVKPDYDPAKLDPQKLQNFQSLLDEVGVNIKVVGPDGTPLSKTSIMGAIEDWKHDAGKEFSWRAQSLFKALDEAYNTGIVEVRPAPGMPHQEVKVEDVLGNRLERETPAGGETSFEFGANVPKAGEPAYALGAGEQANMFKGRNEPAYQAKVPTQITPRFTKGTEGTPLFEKSVPPEDALFALPRPNIRTGLSEKAAKLVPTGVREFWSPLSTLPQSEELLTARYRALGDMSKVDRIVDNVSAKVKNLPDDIKKQMFLALDGKIPIDTLPVEYRGTVRLLNNLSDMSGRMLVKRGLISEETFNANKGKYIHYMYLKHVLGEDAPITGAGGRIDVSILKQRQNLTTDQKKAIGLIEDVSTAAPVGLSKSLGDVAKYDYFKIISENPDWTWQPSVIDVNGKRYGLGELKDEVATYKKIVSEFPSNQEVATRYNELKTSLEGASQQAGKLPKDYVELPNTATYGPLRGVAVRKEIAADIKPLFSIKNEDVGRLWRTAIDINERAVAAFKLGKVPFNLPTVTRNIVSNIFQLNMSGIPLGEIPIWYGKALKQVAEKSPAYAQAFRNGLFKTNWGVQEIGDIMSRFNKINTGAVHQIVAAARDLAKYYGKIDDITKFAKFLERIENGVPVNKAIIEAQKWGMDYSLASRSIKMMRQNIIPFASYSYKIVPLLAETAIERPHVLAKFAVLPSLVQNYVRDEYSIDDKQWEKLRRDLPLFIRENQTFMILPVKDAKGNFKWVDINYFFPWGNLTQAGSAASKGQVGETLQQLGVGSNPFLLLANTFARTGNPKDPFTGRELYNDLDTPKEKLQKSLEYVYNMFMPSMLTRYGALGQTLNIGEPQKYGRSTETPDALLRFFGVNMITPTREQARANLKAKQSELRSALYQRMRDPTITKEQRTDLIRRYRELATGVGPSE